MQTDLQVFNTLRPCIASVDCSAGLPFILTSKQINKQTNKQHTTAFKSKQEHFVSMKSNSLVCVRHNMAFVFNNE
jgi:hypothetical protein